MKAIQITVDDSLLAELDADEEVQDSETPAEGLKQDSAVNLDHVQTVDQARLSKYIGPLDPARLRAVCHALAVATGCDG